MIDYHQILVEQGSKVVEWAKRRAKLSLADIQIGLKENAKKNRTTEGATAEGGNKVVICPVKYRSVQEPSREEFDG